MHRCVGLQKLRDDSVTGFVVRGQPLFLFADYLRLFLRSDQYLYRRFLEVVHTDKAFTLASREQRRFVQEIREVRAGEADRSLCERVKVYVFLKRLAVRVNLEYFLASVDIRVVYRDLAVKASGTQQRRVEYIRTVGRRDDDDSLVAAEAVHLDEQLVQCLLALVVTAAESGSAVTSDRVDFVYEYDARRILLSGVEQVAHTRRADADVHLDEIRTGDRVERNPGLSGYRLCEQGFTCAGRSHEQDAVRYVRAEPRELSRIAQELDDLDELLLLLIRSGYILEVYLLFLVRAELGASLAEAAYLAALAAGSRELIDYEEPEYNEQYDYYRVRQQADPPRDIDRFGDVVLLDDAVAELLLYSVAELLPEHVVVAQLERDYRIVLLYYSQPVVAVYLKGFDLLFVEQPVNIAVNDLLARLIAEQRRRREEYHADQHHVEDHYLII